MEKLSNFENETNEIEIDEEDQDWGDFFETNEIELRYGKILKTIFVILFLAAAVCLAITLLAHYNPNIKSYFGLPVDLTWVYLTLSILIILFGAALLDLFYSRVIITDQSIIYHSLFGTKSLHLNEMKGYFEIDNYIVFTPIDESKSDLKITRYFKNDYYLSIWAEYYLENSLEVEKEEELDEATNEMNVDAVELQNRISKWKKATTALNILTGISFVLVLLFEKWVFITGCILFFSPIVFYLVLRVSNGSIKFYSRENSVFPSLFYTIIGCGVIFAFASCYNISIISKIDHFWTLPLSIGLLIWYFFKSYLNEKKDKLIEKVLVNIFFIVYLFLDTYILSIVS
jgi:hypothetical protein